MKQLLVIFLVLTTAIANLYSQEHEKCGSSRDLESIRIYNPKLYEEIMKLEKFTQNYIKTLDSKSQEQIITIPVVVHVVWKTQTEKINKTVVDSQIEVLNEDYRRQNSDAVNTPTEFHDESVDTKIEFYLACKDPQGYSTTGITYTETTKNYFIKEGDTIKYSSLGGHDAWPSDDYLNIWVCDLEEGLYGYAQFPGGDDDTDGVVIDYQAFGTEPPAEDPYDLGRTTTHEVGHWLNLYHIWGNGGCVSDDFVADTPMQFDSYYGLCPDHPQTSCDSHDMFMNYMDYTNDECMNLFTAGQKDRMRALFSTGGPRESFTEKCIQNLGSLNLYIDGHDLVCSTNKTFELNNLPENTCADIEWTKSSNLEAVSGQGTDSFTVKATSAANGPGWVKATITDDCGDESITYNIDWVGKPNPSILGPDELDCGFSEWYFVDSDSYQWGDFYWSTDNNLDILSTTTGHKAEIEGLSEGWGQVFVEVTNSCGSKEVRLVVWVNCFDFFLFPNPANEIVEIKLDESKTDLTTVEEYEIKIYNSQQILLQSIKSKKISNTINTSQLTNGTYFIQVTYKGKSYMKQLVIQH